MSRLRRIEQRDRYFFVTTNLATGVAPLSPDERTSVLNEWNALRPTKVFFLYAYVVMPTHAHFLIYPQGSDLTDLMRDFKSKTALELNRRRVRDFHEKWEYIHANPVEAGLVAKASRWE